jgi:hypothetical protein
MLASAEFEFAIQRSRLPTNPIVLPASVVEILGAYGACCCFLQREPATQHFFIHTRSRYEISQQMIKFLTLFQIDEPEMRSIDYMLCLT